MELKELYKELAEDIQFIYTRLVFFYDQKYKLGLTLNKRDKVYLLRKNITIKQLSDKLDYKKLSLFKIREVKRLVNYQLKLPKSIRIYDVFYILLLEKILHSTLLVLFIEINQLNLEEEQDIDKLLNCQYFNKIIRYLVKWLDRLDLENSQEPKRNLNYPKKLEEFHQLNLGLLKRNLKQYKNYNLQEEYRDQSHLAKSDYQEAAYIAQ